MNKKNNDKIEQDRQERVEKCTAAIQEALKDNNCALEVAVIVSQGGNHPVANIVAKD